MKALDDDCAARLAKLVDGHKVLGIKLVNDKLVLRAGTKVVENDLYNKYIDGTLKLDQLDVEKSWFAEESMMNNVRQLMHNYAAKKVIYKVQQKQKK